MRYEDYRLYRTMECPHNGCGGTGKRHSSRRREIRDLHETITATVPVFKCDRCGKHFVLPHPHLPHPKRLHATARLIAMCGHLRRQGKTIAQVIDTLKKDFNCDLSVATAHDYMHTEV